jgi:hypothetical protein
MQFFRAATSILHDQLHHYCPYLFSTPFFTKPALKLFLKHHSESIGRSATAASPSRKRITLVRKKNFMA